MNLDIDSELRVYPFLCFGFQEIEFHLRGLYARALSLPWMDWAITTGHILLHFYYPDVLFINGVSFLKFLLGFLPNMTLLIVAQLNG